MLHIELLRDQGVAIFTPEGKLQATDFERAGREIDPYIESHGALRGLMIRVKTFPGWADFEAFITHLRFVKDHHLRIRRIAAVSDSAVIKIVPAIAKHFVAAEVRHFPIAETERALAWLEKDQ